MRDAAAEVAPSAAPAAEPSIVVYGARERVRSAMRAAFPKRRARLVFVRNSADLRRAMCAELVDAVLVDLGLGSDDGWTAAALAREFTSTAFVAVAPLRASEGEMLARCAALGMAEILVDGVDDAVVKSVLGPLLFTGRFAAVLRTPPPALRLDSPLQRAAWARVVEGGGRIARTSELAGALNVTREHLSRSFGRGAPLKGVLDLVRLIAAAELARSPGYRVRDIATVLGFATPSHFARSAARIAGRPPSELAALGAAELIAYFAARHVGGTEQAE